VTDAGPIVGIGVDREVPVERVQLDEISWVDVARGWLQGADELHAELLESVAWQTSRLFRYDHYIEEKRLGSFWSRGRPLPHAGLGDATRALQARYKVMFEGFGLLQYRDGGDGQAFHRDTDMRWLDDTVVAILTLGARRPWLLRPKSARHTLADGRGATHDLSPGSGDLIVMGGACQAAWEHSVPYLGSRPTGIRISVQWRHARKVGRPFQGAGYRAPLTYSNRGR
jgi:alkylated DNA repair dioxygenase AlkB